MRLNRCASSGAQASQARKRHFTGGELCPLVRYYLDAKHLMSKLSHACSVGRAEVSESEYNHPHQYAPSFATTALTVFHRIRASCMIDQFST